MNPGLPVEGVWPLDRVGHFGSNKLSKPSPQTMGRHLDCPDGAADSIRPLGVGEGSGAAVQRVFEGIKDEAFPTLFVLISQPGGGRSDQFFGPSAIEGFLWGQRGQSSTAVAASRFCHFDRKVRILQGLHAATVALDRTGRTSFVGHVVLQGPEQVRTKPPARRLGSIQLTSLQELGDESLNRLCRVRVPLTDLPCMGKEREPIGNAQLV